MPQSELAPVINIVGFTTGIVLYAMLGVMTARRPSGITAGGGEFPARLPLLAAVLGLLWNVGGLVIFGLRDFGLAEPPPLLVAIAFSALGFLPAVAVHAAVQGNDGARSRPLLIVAAYVLSSSAAALHAVGIGAAALPSRSALVLLTAGYAVLLVVLAIVTRGDASWRRGLSTVALAAFAVSALHLSHGTSQDDSWLVALVGHHASLPLVLIILYQDFRFAFADLFLRRALSLMALVAVALTLHVLVVSPVLASRGGSSEGVVTTALHVALGVFTALAYPLILRVTSALVDRVMLRRASLRHVSKDVASAISQLDDCELVAQRAGRLIADALGASNARHAIAADERVGHGATVMLHGEGRDGATVRIPTVVPPGFLIEVNGLRHGRRLLSDDVALLESVAAVVGRRIDAIRVTQERFERDLREREILQLAAESELKALRAQLNPHFLFNALTTIGYLLQSAPERALGTLYRLTDLLRAVLRRPSGELVTLGEELEIVEAYLAIERERFEERLLVHVDVPDELRDARIPPLLLQPLVENAVKHGISPLKRGGSVSVSAAVHATPPRREMKMLRLVVSDTGAGMETTSRVEPRGSGVGLASVEHRLQQLYGASASLDVASGAMRGTSVTVTLPYTAGALDVRAPEPAGMRSAG